MIDPVSSIMSYAMARNRASMSITKSRMEAEAMVAQVVIEAAQNIQRIMESSSDAAASSIGSNIDIYV
jgi:hypothetical protein